MAMTEGFTEQFSKREVGGQENDDAAQSTAMKGLRVRGRRRVALVVAGALLAVVALPAHATASPSWLPPVPLKAHVYSVSCPSTSFCVAAGLGGYVTTYDGTSWSAPVNVDGGRPIETVSCPTESFCVGVDTDGYAVAYDGASWGTPVHFDTTFAPYDTVSCASASFCVAVNQHDEAWTYNGSSWTGPVEVEGGSYGLALGISCASASFCAIVDNDGTTDIFGGSTWTHTANTGNGHLQSVSCVSPAFCATVGSEGYASIYNGTSWTTTPNPVDYGDGTESLEHYLYAVSCATTSFCIGADLRGYVVTYNGSSWSAPLHVVGAGELTSISCPTTTFCVAVGGFYAYFFGEGSPPENVASPAVVGTPAVGEELLCEPGSWSGSPTPTLAYQWTRDEGDVYKATAETYVVQAADRGHTLACRVTASNIFGQSSATSAGMAVPSSSPEGGGSGEDGRESPVPARIGNDPPQARITSHPAVETADQRAIFTFTGIAGGSYECSVDADTWKSCRSGADFGPLPPGDHRFRVRESLNGLTGPADTYSWTIALPKKCVLRVARARVFVSSHQRLVRLVIRYKTYHPAKVTVSYELFGRRGKLALGRTTSYFSTVGVFRRARSLRQKEMRKIRAARLFKLRFGIPKAPGFCARYYTKRLTIRKRFSGQVVWFQSDSIFR